MTLTMTREEWWLVHWALLNAKYTRDVDGSLLKPKGTYDGILEKLEGELANERLNDGIRRSPASLRHKLRILFRVVRIGRGSIG